MNSNGQFSDADEDSEQGQNNQNFQSDSDGDDEFNYNDIIIDGTGHFTHRLNDNREGRYRCNRNPTSSSTMQPKAKVMEKYNCKIHLDKFVGLQNYSGSVTNKLLQHEISHDNIITHKDKKDDATVENVFDQQTLTNLQKIIKRCKLEKVYGCISTGKEANVYYAVDKENKEFAIKVYKTSCITFKNRKQYIDGNHSCKYSKKPKSTRKMVDTWSGKEFRNLGLLKKATGIFSPAVIDRISNVLIMDFIGKDGDAAPKLKDAYLTTERAYEQYKEIVKAVRILFINCKLVHADLSEYNILYFDEKPYIIDVSQSVESGHPKALEFLRKDLTNITSFFAKKSVPTIRLSELFYFVITDNLKIDDIDEYLEMMMNNIQDDSELNMNDEEVFKNINIPRTLNEITSFETINDPSCSRLLADNKPILNEEESTEVHTEDQNPAEDEQEGTIAMKNVSVNTINDLDNNEADLVLDKLTLNTEESAENIHNQVENSVIECEGAVVPESISVNTLDQKSSDESKRFMAEKLRRRPAGRPKDETPDERHERKRGVKAKQAEGRTTKMKKHVKHQLVSRSSRRR